MLGTPCSQFPGNSYTPKMFRSTTQRSTFLLGATLGASMALLLMSIRGGCPECPGPQPALPVASLRPACPPIPLCPESNLHSLGQQQDVAVQGAAAVPSLSACSRSGGTQRVFDEFKLTSASKEVHCFSWMYGDLLGRFHCKGSLQHSAANGERLRMLVRGLDLVAR